MDNTTNTGCTGHQYRQQINLTVPMISNPNVIHLWEIESSGICHNLYIYIYSKNRYDYHELDWKQ